MARLGKRTSLIGAAAALALLAGCDQPETGPVAVSAIGGPPRLANPNLEPIDPPSAFLAESAAQGLVQFDAVGEIEPALAQSWIVSDDGLRYTFRIRRSQWPDRGAVTAEQVAARLRAAVSRASRNPLKPVLAAIEDVEAMTDRVLEIRLRGPRPNFLQLLAQAEMAILVNNEGTGPYRVAGSEQGAMRLAIPGDEEDDEPIPPGPGIALRGERAAFAVARFAEGEADLVLGGTVGDLPLARAADLPDQQLVYDPAGGLFGLAFTAAEDGPLADPVVRRAISMAVDRQALAAAIGVPGLRPRTALVPPIVDELARPALPDWAPAPMPMRRELASRVTARLDAPLRLRVAMPEGAGYRIVFALLRRDWRLIGVEAERVATQAPADLRLIDAVAPAMLASWYLRHFTCDTDRACDPAADQALEAARDARTQTERQAQLAEAARILTEQSVFIPLASPVRWSLVSPRLTGFRPNPFARHPAGTLIAEEQ
jgi:ABC-type oligopeptide transport system substrate-binding subunit